MHFVSFDGAKIACTEMGSGEPLLLIHGLFSNAHTNWVKYGTAEKLAAAGWRVIMPDLRGHGGSDAPPEESGWPDEVLAMDAEALIAHLGLGNDLIIGGYSLGARTTVRLLARGLRPRAAILAGMGLEGIIGAAGRSDWFIRLIDGLDGWKPGDPQFMAAAFLKANIPDPKPLLHLLRQQKNTDTATLAEFNFPTLVVCGVDDDDNGSAPALADALPQGQYAEIPGNHMASVTKPELADAMLRFLAGL
ncbi:MAG: alpha/beta fold hydrolase [Sphingomonadaceae bacterium]